MIKFLFQSASLCLLLIACAPQAAIPKVSNEDAMTEIRLQLETAARETMVQVKRVDEVATALILANASLCGNLTTYHGGFSAATRESFDEDLADGMTAAYGIQSTPTIYAVHKGTDAYRFLREGDVITGVNGTNARRKMSGLRKIAETVEKGNAFTLNINRDGKPLQVTLMPARVCASPVAIEKDDAINAHANGVEMTVTTGMLRFIKDDNELALILGHELAHNMRRHTDAKAMNRMIGAMLGTVITLGTGMDFGTLFENIGHGAFSQDFESEADYVGLYYAARSGYKIAHAPDLWRRMGAAESRSIHLAGTTHPSTAKRFLALKATVKEITFKEAAGIPLIPGENRRSFNLWQ